MAWGRIATVAAIMTGVNIKSMCPTVVQIGVPLISRGAVVVGIVATTGVVVATVVVVVGGTVGHAGLILLNLLAELVDFGIFDRVLLD